jgi:hypothetical protein
MMESLKPFLTRQVEMWENERFQLSALSFSAKGLLPTDRYLTYDIYMPTLRAIYNITVPMRVIFIIYNNIISYLSRTNCSTQNGYVGWASQQLMEESFLSTGWEWDGGSAWSAHVQLGGTDENGWVYAVSFGSIEEEGKAVCGR